MTLKLDITRSKVHILSIKIHRYAPGHSALCHGINQTSTYVHTCRKWPLQMSASQKFSWSVQASARLLWTCGLPEKSDVAYTPCFIDNCFWGMSRVYFLTLTLIQSSSKWIDALGHTPTSFWSVMSCHLCFLYVPWDSHPQVLVDCAPPVCTWMTWTTPRNLPVQRLSRYALVIHSYHMSQPAVFINSASMSSIVCCPVLTLTASFVTL